MFVIKKYSSSGIWTGESVKAFTTAHEAHLWLEEKSDKAECLDCGVSVEFDSEKRLTRLDIQLNFESWTYAVVYEADEVRGAS